MTDYVSSLVDNYKGKIRNPFIGTIISVWLIRNWIVVYALFNFDSDRTMECKINFITSYFSKIDFKIEILICFFYALSTLLVTFALLAISRYVTDTYYKTIEPSIITKIDKNAIFTIRDKENLESVIDRLAEKLDKNKEALSKAENYNEFLQAKNNDIDKKYDLELSSLSNKLKEANSNNENYSKYYEKINPYLKRLENIKGGFSRFESEILNDLSDSDEINYNNEYNQQAINNLKLIGLIGLSQNNNFYLTDFGKIYISLHPLHDSTLERL